MFTPADPGIDATAVLKEQVAACIKRHEGKPDRAATDLIYLFQMRATTLGVYHEDAGERQVYSLIGGFTG